MSLFAADPSEPLTFYLTVFPERSRIAKAITDHGGVVSRRWSPDLITLASSKQAASTAAQFKKRCFSYTFVDDCIAQNRLLKLDPYALHEWPAPASSAAASSEADSVADAPPEKRPRRAPSARTSSPPPSPPSSSLARVRSSPTKKRAHRSPAPSPKRVLRDIEQVGRTTPLRPRELFPAPPLLQPQPPPLLQPQPPPLLQPQPPSPPLGGGSALDAAQGAPAGAMGMFGQEREDQARRAAELIASLERSTGAPHAAVVHALYVVGGHGDRAHQLLTEGSSEELREFMWDHHEDAVLCSDDPVAINKIRRLRGARNVSDRLRFLTAV